MIHNSPIGELTLVGGERGGLGRLLFEGECAGGGGGSGPALARADEQLSAYFTGSLSEFELELDLVGTPFQRRVWRALAVVPYGQTTTYSALAGQLADAFGGGRPQARAVGSAVAATPVPIVIPCHRVVGADGSLTGYRGGLQIKRALLAFEHSGGRLEALSGALAESQLALL
jgi:methylated-DNA-[protein]-cysteine S-methyltransferase